MNIRKIVALSSVVCIASSSVFSSVLAYNPQETNLKAAPIANSISTPDNNAGSQTTPQTQQKMPYVPGEILVQFKPEQINLQQSNSAAQIQSFSQEKLLVPVSTVWEDNISLMKIATSETVEQAVARLKGDSRVAHAQPNYQYYTRMSAPNDTNFSNLWGLKNTWQMVDGVLGTPGVDVDWFDALDIFSGATSSPTATGVVVAVIDTGVAYNHPELINQMWDGANCKDENGNFLGGCLHGYDYEDDDVSPLPTHSSHGTHVAGTIAAQMNNLKGIAGLNPNAKIMGIKSSLTTENIVKAINFATHNGATVINASWGGGYSTCSGAADPLAYDAIQNFPGLFVAAAGNGSANHNGVDYFDFPSDFGRDTVCWSALDNVISVSATDSNDHLASFSDYGSFVDVGAPGVSIYSTIADTGLFSEDFNSVNLGEIPNLWLTGGTDPVWQIYNFGDSFWKKVLYAGSSNAPYWANANMSLTTPAVDLSGTDIATFSVNALCDTEYNMSSWSDYMEVEYSNDGVNFAPIPNQYMNGILRWDEAVMDYLNGDSNPNGSSAFGFWNIQIPQSYRTSQFKLRFTWKTNDSDNNYKGCAIDEVIVDKFTDGSDERYAFYDGTSMAAPHVAALASLAWSYRPELPYIDIKNTILTNGDSITSLSGVVATGKRINAYKTLAALTNPKVNDLKLYTNSGKTQEIASGSLVEAVTPYVEWQVPTNQGIMSSYDVKVDYSATGAIADSAPITGNSFSGSSATGSIQNIACQDNGFYRVSVQGINDVGTRGDWESIQFHVDAGAPTISQKEVSHITQTGAQVQFQYTDSNFSSGTGYVIVYTGADVLNFVETGALSLVSSSGVATFGQLAPATTYDYLISLTDNVGNNSTSTGFFITASTPVALTGSVTSTGATTLTGGVVGTGETLDLSGSNLVIDSNPLDPQSITGSLTISGTNITVSGSGAWNGILVPPTLISSGSSNAATGGEIGTGIVVIQTIKTGAEGASLVPSSGTGYFVVSFAIPGYASGTIFDLYRSDDGNSWTRVAPDATCTLDANSMCTFRTNHLSFFAPVFDSTPDAFSFTPQTGVETSTQFESNTITVTGINTGATVSIVGGQYKIGAGSYTSASSTVMNGNTVTVRLTSSGWYLAPNTATLTIGGVAANFVVTTRADQSSGSSGGSGGGGGGIGSSSLTKKDVCPSGDTSGNHYDGKCGVSATGSTSSNTKTGQINKPGKIVWRDSASLAAPFADVSDSFAKTYISQLAQRGVVKGYSDGTFKPDNAVTRAEFLSMVMKNAQISVDAKATTSFVDIPEEGAWMIPYIAKAKALGIITGQEIDGKLKFRPNDSITRAEAMAILLRTYGMETDPKAVSDFVDVPTVGGEWMIPYIAKAKALGIITGQEIDGKLKFRPNDSITRAEAAKVIIKAGELQ